MHTILVTRLVAFSDRFLDPLPLRADRFDRKFLLTLTCVVAFIGICYWSLGAYWRVSWFSGEDGLIEWVSVSMYVATAVMTSRTAWSLTRLGHPRLGLFHFLFALTTVLVILEEISWGQRLFNWTTPEALSRINIQGETNLHNIKTFEYLIYTTLLWACLLALGGAGLRTVLHYHHRVTTADFILPTLSLSPGFLTAVIWIGAGQPFTFVRSILWLSPQGSEYPEVLLGFSLLLYAYANLSRTGILGRHNPPISRSMPRFPRSNIVSCL